MRFVATDQGAKVGMRSLWFLVVTVLLVGGCCFTINVINEGI